VYQIRYGREDSFGSTFSERLLFVPQFSVRDLEVGVVYRFEVRASTIGLSGETLWGPFAILRIRDGKGIVHSVESNNMYNHRN
jgi:hypothetical protein